MKIRARKLANGSLFKLLIIGHSATLLLFTLICSVASVFGKLTVKMNGEPVTGIVGLIAALVLYSFFCISFSAVLWVIHATGLWIYSIFWRIELEFVDAEVISSQPPAGIEASQPVEPETL